MSNRSKIDVNTVVSKNVLLVEPDFPYPNKSKHKANSIHKNFVPIGLLKLGAFYKSKGYRVKLVRGLKSQKTLGSFKPDLILITSLFTYWSKFMWDTVSHYRSLFPSTEIMIGGIYVTLHHARDDFKEKVTLTKTKPHIGLHLEAEQFYPDYSLLHGDEPGYHLTHATRGCIRRCPFCGTWKIEPQFTHKTTSKIVEEIKKVRRNNVIFLDNNFFANPEVKELFTALSELRIKGKPVQFESQSGFDGRLIERDPELAVLLKKARFKNVRIAWDNSVKDAQSIKKQIDILTKAGYNPKNLSIFMIYNFMTPYEDMLQKLSYCKKWGVQIIDCRYRPLESISDNYSPHVRKGQTEQDYYIHTIAGWTDSKIRDFRSKVRKHNIWVRYAMDKGAEYDRTMERWSGINSTFKYFNLGSAPELTIINSSNRWKERIQMLNKIRNHYSKNDLAKPILTGLTRSELDVKLNRLCSKIDNSK